MWFKAEDIIIKDIGIAQFGNETRYVTTVTVLPVTIVMTHSIDSKEDERIARNAVATRHAMMMAEELGGN